MDDAPSEASARLQNEVVDPRRGGRGSVIPTPESHDTEVMVLVICRGSRPKLTRGRIGQDHGESRIFAHDLEGKTVGGIECEAYAAGERYVIFPNTEGAWLESHCVLVHGCVMHIEVHPRSIVGKTERQGYPEVTAEGDGS